MEVDVGQAIRIFHDPGHTRTSIAWFEASRPPSTTTRRQFGPYPYSHISVVERPGNGTGMHADASMLTFTEGTALWNPGDDPASLDLPFAVMAHEMAHQWTVPYAHVEGAPVMSESLAWYYGDEGRGARQGARATSAASELHAAAVSVSADPPR